MKNRVDSTFFVLSIVILVAGLSFILSQDLSQTGFAVKKAPSKINLGLGIAPPRVQPPIGSTPPVIVTPPTPQQPKEVLMQKTITALTPEGTPVTINMIKQPGGEVLVKSDPKLDEKTLQNLVAPFDFDGYIVELQNPPLLEVSARANDKQGLVALGTDIAVARGNIDAEQSAFLNKLSAPGFVKTKELRVKNSFKTAINALVLDISEADVQSIKKFSEVKKVTPNYKVHPVLQDSVPLIGADSVWLLDADGNQCSVSGKPCLTGTGVRIGIIDTGVDYTHPDLGGCLGANCKVVGGYDFVNQDADPIDDHGHGTHVAATAAGSGILKGVAPDAKIYAYKVLNMYGSGTFADVIAAIEKSFDLNGNSIPNENIDDRLDVISLSLGGWGDPNDPPSQAIDRAVANDVVAVVAAGNSGPSQGTIGTPGAARRALTVGATDKADALAYFSSKGPTIAGIKPDITAPGVSICAAEWDSWYTSRRCIDDKHIAISGTSMATPHVSGAAAILRQKNPSWTARDIKNVLKLTAKDLGLQSIEQGKGRLDIAKARTFNQDPPPFAELYIGGIVNGVIDIKGFVDTRNFKQYTLSYARGTILDGVGSWIALLRSTTPPTSDILMQGFDTRNFADGDYTFRLVVENNNNFTNDFNNEVGFLTFNNFEILQPTKGDIFRAGDTITISGNNYLSDTLTVEFGQGITPAQWSSTGITIPSGSKIGDNVLFAKFDTSSITTADYYTIKIVITMPSGTTAEERLAIYLDPTLRQGWPQKLKNDVYCAPDGSWCSYATIYNYPTVIDINNDGLKEILSVGNLYDAATGTYNRAHAFEPDGTEANGWPVKFMWYASQWGLSATQQSASIVAGGDGPSTVFSGAGIVQKGWPVFLNGMGEHTSLVDVNNDLVPELILNKALIDLANDVGHLYVLDLAGNVLSGWPAQVGGWQWVAPVKINDKLFVGSTGYCYWSSKGNGCHNGKLTATNLNGQKLWEKTDYESVPSLMAGNVVGSPEKELIAGVAKVTSQNTLSCEVQVFDAQGNLLQGWPQQIYCYQQQPIVLADIDDDALLDIVTVEKIFKGDGTVLKMNNITHQKDPPQKIAVGDVNNDGREDLLIQSWGFDYTLGQQHSKINAYSIDGNLLFSKKLRYTSVSDSPTIVDIDNDGKLELVAIDAAQAYVWNLDVPVGKASWPMVDYDSEHSSSPSLVSEPTPQPDFTPLNASFTSFSGSSSTVYVGDTAEVQATVKNQGSINAVLEQYGSAIDVTINSSSVQNYPLPLTAESFAAGETKIIGGKRFTFTTAGTYCLYANIDVKNLVAESDETNNELKDSGCVNVINPSPQTCQNKTTDCVVLNSVKIGSVAVDVNYSKNFNTCGHLLNEKNKITHAWNFFCQSGENVNIRVNLIHINVSVGNKYKLCHGNNYGICSSFATAIGIPDFVPLNASFINLKSLSSQVHVGDTAEAQAIVKNQGTKSAILQQYGSTIDVVNVNTASKVSYLIPLADENFAVGETKQLGASKRFNFTTKGTYCLNANIDVKNLVLEFDEANNELKNAGCVNVINLADCCNSKCVRRERVCKRRWFIRRCSWQNNIDKTCYNKCLQNPANYTC